MPTVACVGITVLDLMFRVSEMPTRPDKHLAHGFHMTGGGVAANAAATVVALGGKALLASRVGPGPLGVTLVRGFAELGVDVGAVHTVPHARTSISTVLVDDAGERLIVNDTDPALFADAEDLPEDAIAAADAVVADTLWPSGAARALEAARSRGRPGLVDFDIVPDHAHDEILATATHVVFGTQALTRLTGAADPETALPRAAGKTPAWVAVTLGADGVAWLDGDKVRRMPAFTVAVVDTLAAGDVFHGALALALAEGRPIEPALRFANAAAALKCTRFGGRDAIPSRAEVNRFLAKRA